jgi:hypothetical protein
MNHCNLILVPCQHGGAATGKDCEACEGSGYVKVVVGQDGRPRNCEHAGSDGDLEECEACLGSGWAGLSE